MILYNRLKDGKKLALTTGYDDGMASDRRLIEIFDKYGIKGTFFLNSSKFDTDGYITSGEIKSLYKNHEVAAHALTHPPFNAIPFPTILSEIIEDRRNIEKACGYVVRGMSYPYGSYNDAIIQTAKDCGISYCKKGARTMEFALPSNFMTWEPTGSHHYAPEIAEKFINRLNNKNYLSAGVCYLCGHSYEFDQENNWYLIEDFCNKLSGLDGVWYATNGEIYDYLTAQKNLHVAADESFVYNPSQVDVWISKDGEPVKIPAGETVCF